MPQSDGDSNSNSNSNSNPIPNPIKAERPLLKKSRTIADDNRTPHFPGPLFPTVRRISTSTPSSHRSFDPDNTSPNTDPFGTQGDRDWMFPSFLGPHASRRRVIVKSSKSQKQELSPRSPAPPPARSASMPANSDSGADFIRPIRAELKPRTKKPNEELKALPVQVLVPYSSSSGSATAHSVAPKTGRFRSSWIMYLLTFTCVLSVSCTICLHTKVANLQEENRNLRRWCNHKDVVHKDSIQVLEPQNESSFFCFGSTDSRTIALSTVLFTLIVPFALYKYIHYAQRLKNLLKMTKDSKEEVPLKKRIAYMVDVCFSVYPYAKLLALLLATIFLIGFGGLALYAVSDSSFAEALWLSWTFVADSGNHADRVGIGPRIVSVSVSAGGMLIFAMMLGLVSDAISEKVDSLRKGKSEVIESNHILILGWSDKLVIP